MKVENHSDVNISNSNSRISFETTGGGTWKVWDRFLAVDKHKIFHIGNICDTCEFFFLKQEENMSIDFNKEILIDSINLGEVDLNKESISQLSKIIPNGDYVVLKSKIRPNLVQANSNNNYFTNEQRETWLDDLDEESHKSDSDFKEYYREKLVNFGTLDYDHKHAFFNFFIPLYEPQNLKLERVEYYKQLLNNDRTATCLSIGVLDVKTSEEYPYINGEEIIPKFGTHWCLAN